MRWRTGRRSRNIEDRRGIRLSGKAKGGGLGLLILALVGMIGDDRLQKQARGYVAPDSFTHGSSAQRVRWFRKGLRSGELDVCDTFAVANP